MGETDAAGGTAPAEGREPKIKRTLTKEATTRRNGVNLFKFSPLPGCLFKALIKAYHYKENIKERL
jgi:hypothetical protein